MKVEMVLVYSHQKSIRKSILSCSVFLVPTCFYFWNKNGMIGLSDKEVDFYLLRSYGLVVRVATCRMTWVHLQQCPGVFLHSAVRKKENVEVADGTFLC